MSTFCFMIYYTAFLSNDLDATPFCFHNCVIFCSSTEFLKSFENNNKFCLSLNSLTSFFEQDTSNIDFTTNFRDKIKYVSFYAAFSKAIIHSQYIFSSLLKSTLVSFPFFWVLNSSDSVWNYCYTHTHTHTYIYIYIYIYTTDQKFATPMDYFSKFMISCYICINKFAVNI